VHKGEMSPSVVRLMLWLSKGLPRYTGIEESSPNLFLVLFELSIDCKKILLEKHSQQCQDNILYVYLNVGVGRVGIGIFMNSPG